jgi:putative flippase GtrA
MIRIIKFFIVGGINTLLTLSTFYLLNKIIGVNYVISTILGYSIGILNSYILNKHWTFQDSDKKVFFQLIRFISVNVISLGINLLVMYILVDRLFIDSMLSQVIATGFSTISNFLGSRMLVFRYSSEKQQLT